MPVNYERAPWDPNNSLAVRLINQRLSEIQRKASFIDTFLHSPRICLYINESTGCVVLFCVLHPAYPVVTAYYTDSNQFQVPPGELTPTYTSLIHSIFTWDRVPYQEVYWRSTDAVGLVCFNRYFRGQYQDHTGKNTLLAQVGVNDGWQSTGAYSCYLEALCLANDPVAGTRPESTWNLDTLWTNKKFIFGRVYERQAEDGNTFYMPPEGDSMDYSDEGETKSESYFPKLPGFHVDYVDSLGVFAPTNFNVDPILTGYFEEFLAQVGAPSDVQEIFGRSCLIKRGIIANNWGDVQSGNYWKLTSGAISTIPVIGGLYGSINTQVANSLSMSDSVKFWPRLYAFGRQYQPAPTPKEMDTLYQWYRTFNNRGQYPDVFAMDKNKFADLVDLLLERQYIQESDVPGWI